MFPNIPSRTLFAALAASAFAVLAPAQERRALFDAPLVIADSTSRITNVLDLDGDGWADAIGWWYDIPAQTGQSPGHVEAWINDGAGKLVRTWQLGFTYYPTTYATPSCVADLNHDGRDDFVFAIGSKVWALLSNGSLPATVISWTEASAVKGAALGDFTANGQVDLALYVNSIFRIYTFDATNSTFSLFSSYDCSCGFDEMIALEGTGDGQKDLLVFAQNGGARLFPVVNGFVQSPIFFYTQISSPMVDAGDIDGDGDIDIVFFGTNYAGSNWQYQIERRTGPSTFTLEPVVVNAGPARKLMDIDGDGDLDGVCCGGGGGNPTAPRNDQPSVFRIALNDGHGNFAPAIEIPGIGSTRIAGIADLDHDGDLDLIAGRCVYYPHGPIRADPAPAVSTIEQRDSIVRDFDGDGDPDLEPGPSSVRRNDGSGALGTFVPLTDPPPPGTTWFGRGYAGDFDGDGDVDIVAPYGYQGSLGARLLLNNGGGGFTDAGQVLPAGEDSLAVNAPEDFFVGDVDGDGDLDLVTQVVSVSWNGALHNTLWLNDGTGHFTSALVLPYERTLGAADFDGDGIPDLLTAQTFLRIRHGYGNGTFASPTNIQNTSVYNRDEIAVADLDHDGDVDICAQQSSIPYGAVIYWNHGSAGFTTQVLLPSTYTSGSVPKVVSAADVDGDGLLDLVISPTAEQNVVAIFLRRSDNSGYEEPVQQTMFMRDPVFGISLSRRTLADLDGDGDPDIVSTRRFTNCRFMPPNGGARRQVGAGIVGTGGMTPTLGATGPFRVGQHSTLCVTGAAPGSHGLMTVSYVDQIPPPFTGGGPMIPATRVRIVAQIGVTTTPASGAPGSGSWSLPYTVPDYVAGRTKRYVVDLVDPTSPSGTARTNDLYITYGP